VSTPTLAEADAADRCANCGEHGAALVRCARRLVCLACAQVMESNATLYDNERTA
jgi:hypothetical protein